MFRALAKEVLDILVAGKAEYGDIRIIHTTSENITVSGSKPEVVRRSESIGYGIRVLLGGAWGFAASDILEKKAVVRTAGKALEIARAGRKAPSDKECTLPADKIEAKFTTPHQKDPFSISLEDKLTLLSDASEILLENKRVRIAKGFSDSVRTKKLFASTTGSLIEQEIITCGGGILALAIKGDDVQKRSYPNSFRGNFATAGWEFVEEMDLSGNAPWVAEEAVALLGAPPCPALDKATVILAPDQLALQIHESIGHPIELDRVFGQEASFAGTSFLDPSMLGSFQYGSPEITVVADATTPRGLGSFGFDDEGTPGQRTTILEKGILRNFLTSCQTAPRLKGSPRSNGTARAQGWRNIPLIRMTNINLEPGTWDFGDLVADTRDGFLLETNKSWSIDDKRINFQFGVEVAREIKKGKIGRLLKNPVYTGITPVFWNSCDAVCNADYWELYGVANCGKGEPMQMMQVGHGAPPARFLNVNIGSAQ